MTNGRRDDLVILAVLLSVVAHLGGMMYARPRVMSHAAPVASHVKTGPMRVLSVSDSVDLPLATPLDSAAEREAPKAESVSRGLEAAALFAGPDDAAAVRAEPPPPATVGDGPVLAETPPEKFDRPATVPVLAHRELTEAAEVIVTPPVEFAPPPPVETRADAVIPAPSFSGLAVADLGEPSAATTVAPEAVPVDQTPPPEFKPSAEVFDEVDERAVEAEKSAVQALVNAPAARLAKSVNVTMTRDAADGWTYFRVMIVPRNDLSVVPKDLVVLIDASGSIGSVRMKSLRESAKAVLRSALNGGDRFNLVAFRDRFTYAFKSWQACGEGSFAAADAWLGDLTAHGRTDVFASIRSVLTLPREPTRPLVAMVITDGVANEGVSDNAGIISRFTALNDGLVSVYMYGVKAQANRDLIVRLTHGNRGEGHVYEGARAAAGAEIGAFSERFRDPVLSDIRVVFAAGCRAEAYPRRLRNLHRGGMVVVVGRVPAGTAEVAFSLRGLNGKAAKEDFFRLPLASAGDERGLAAEWQAEARAE